MNRFDMVWGFYQPGILRQWMWTAVALFVVYLLALMSRFTHSFVLFGLTNVLVVLPVYFGPIVFATYRDRSLQILLPASGAEKAVFMLLYTVVVLPLVVVAMWYIYEGIFSLLGVAPDVLDAFDVRIDTDFNKLGLKDFVLFNPLRICSELFPPLVCLYVVVSSKTQRVLKGVCGIVGGALSLSFFSGIYGAVLGIRTAHLESTGVDIEQALKISLAETYDVAHLLMSIGIPLILLAGIAMIWRRIVKVQV